MLPIEDVIPQLRTALTEASCTVLVAPPGAGKTTVVPLRLLDQPWLQGRKILMLEPRRLAARMAAERMASTLGQKVGETVGYRVRLQSRVSARTRIEVVTEGVFTRMILDDPSLEGVGAVLFDEFHERSLDADLGLALARDAQLVLREDLRILVMSATLDGAAVGKLLGDAPVVESDGRAFPVKTSYFGRGETLEDQVVRTVERALAAETGSLLVFLPGQAEIRRTEERLRDRVRAPNVIIAPLYGAMDPADQDKAVAPAPSGSRKVVLATSIAETSLTIEGVRVVIDSGLSRTPRFDPSSGLTRLSTIRVSRAAADQRRGRAGRIEPGVCYRLWDEAETRALPAFADPEILEADLGSLALDLARWGVRDPAHLAFLDPPPAMAFSEARGLLQRLGAISPEGILTAHGEALSVFPLAPRLAHMILRASEHGQANLAAEIAALASEPALGGRDTHLIHRLETFRRDRGGRARDAKGLADRWVRLAGKAGDLPPVSEGLLLALAYPERVAKARGPLGEFQLVNGRGAYLDATDVLAREPWLSVAELGSGDRRDRIRLAAPIDPAEIETLFADQIETEVRLEESGGGRLRALKIRRLGRLHIDQQVAEPPDPELLVSALLDRVRRDGLASLNWGEGAKALRSRIAYMKNLEESAWPDFSDLGLMQAIELWLAPLLFGLRSLKELKPEDLEAALRAQISWERQKDLDQALPARWTAPTGNSFAIDYRAEGGPRVEVRVQETFGLTSHPTIAGGKVALTLALLSPGHRPIQTTKDLPGFWAGSWRDVRSDMRGRYPKHVWPEDPSTAPPTARAKPRGT
ncbi:MAG: ATP-dependent helicase HrpB [Alphaproteobacteria bacterium]